MVQHVSTQDEDTTCKVVVRDVRHNPRRPGKEKNDRLYVRRLAEWLHLGTLKPVYHQLDPLVALRRVFRAEERFFS